MQSIFLQGSLSISRGRGSALNRSLNDAMSSPGIFLPPFQSLQELLLQKGAGRKGLRPGSSKVMPKEPAHSSMPPVAATPGLIQPPPLLLTPTTVLAAPCPILAPAFDFWHGDWSC